MLERLELFLYRRAALIVPVTHAFRDDLVARGIDPGKICVVRNGVDLERYAPAAPDPALAKAWNVAGKFVVGYLGTHGMAHALHRVLDAAVLLRDRDDIVFLFAGGGAERAALEARAEALGLPNVRMLPRQPKAAMPALWALCSVALIPLRDQPVFATVLPSKLFEAMGMGVPVLMSLPPGEATDIVASTGCGVCVPPEDPEALAQAVAALADDPGRLAGLAAAAAAAAGDFSRDALSSRMLDLLERTGESAAGRH
jgi:glycosyltransferase involved in cell wall biosynthesis